MKWKQRVTFIFFCVFFLCILHFRNRNSDLSSTNNGKDIENSRRSLSKTKQDVYMHPWDIWSEMPNNRAITSMSELQIDLILNAMSNSKILKADVGHKGTQLKAQFILSGPTPQEVVFKPKRYPRDKVLSGTPYEGFDRHNGEIAAFHLDRILGFYRAPPVVGRIVNLRSDVMPVTSKKLLKTFWRDDGGNFCFYGKCMYCKKEESACGNGEIMESSMTLWLPPKWKLYKMRHPWQRTYNNKKARWELDPNYCEKVVKKPPYNKGSRLLDLMDTAVFDFLIGNADRHHYEFTSDGETSMVVHLDNGKSFGNPHHDELSILKPLMQCCTLRHSTYIAVSSFTSDFEKNLSLSHKLKEKLKSDPIYPILTEDHLNALDRRLDVVMNKLKECFEQKGRENVLVKDE